MMGFAAESQMENKIEVFHNYYQNVWGLWGRKSSSGAVGGAAPAEAEAEVCGSGEPGLVGCPSDDFLGVLSNPMSAIDLALGFPFKILLIKKGSERVLALGAFVVLSSGLA